MSNKEIVMSAAAERFKELLVDRIGKDGYSEISRDIADICIELYDFGYLEAISGKN